MKPILVEFATRISVLEQIDDNVVYGAQAPFKGLEGGRVAHSRNVREILRRLLKSENTSS
jgi:hypothetical protein